MRVCRSASALCRTVFLCVDCIFYRAYYGKISIVVCRSAEVYHETKKHTYRRKRHRTFPAVLPRFVEKLERIYPEVNYVNRLITHSWGQRVVRFYDPDGNLIEVGTPM